MKNFSVIELSKCHHHFVGYYSLTIYNMTLYEQDLIYQELIKRYTCSGLEKISKSNIDYKSYINFNYGIIKNYRFLVDISNVSSEVYNYRKKVRYVLYLYFIIRYENIDNFIKLLMDVCKSLNFRFIDHFRNLIDSDFEQVSKFINSDV